MPWNAFLFVLQDEPRLLSLIKNWPFLDFFFYCKAAKSRSIFLSISNVFSRLLVKKADSFDMTVDSRYFWYYVSGIVVGRQHLKKCCSSLHFYAHVVVQQIDWTSMMIMMIRRGKSQVLFYIWLLYLKIQWCRKSVGVLLKLEFHSIFAVQFTPTPCSNSTAEKVGSLLN